jgi:hypothetical protein
MKQAFEQFDGEARARLLEARQLILSAAADLEEAGSVEESLKWGQPSYATKPKTGTPIRLGVTKDGSPTLFVHCQTTLVADLAADNAYGLKTIDNRAVVLPVDDVKAHPGGWISVSRISRALPLCFAFGLTALERSLFG